LTTTTEIANPSKFGRLYLIPVTGAIPIQ